uniref:Uncharacterized protein n=2 Tax=Anguilla anguilla TaxID=7936 RepID=A0A0E9VNQ3_ANGAN
MVCYIHFQSRSLVLSFPVVRFHFYIFEVAVKRVNTGRGLTDKWLLTSEEVLPPLPISEEVPPPMPISDHHQIQRRYDTLGQILQTTQIVHFVISVLL